ncbi:MAG TPA: DUF4349 domain-containing protein, partial [Clostridia bacterium]|nr:DUF4349 domain-containing protein [Clostridia bacterium]
DMKKNNMFIWTCILLLSMTIAISTGCAASKDAMPIEEMSDSSASPQSESFDTDTKYEGIAEEGIGSQADTVGGKRSSIQKIITNASLRVYAEDAGQVADSIESKVKELDGYIAESYRGEDSGGKLYVNIEAKIPAEKFSIFIDYIEKQGKVKNKDTTTQDITEEYYDIKSRLSHAEKQETQLLKIMGDAKTIDEILQVQQSLDSIQERIEQLKGKINLWDQLVSLSTIQIYVENESKLVGDREDDTRVISFEEIGRGIKNGIISTFKFTVNVLGYLVIAFFYLLIPGTLVIVIILIIRWILKRRGKKEPPENKQEQQ